MTSKAKIQVAGSLSSFFESELHSVAQKQGSAMTPIAQKYLARILEKFSSMDRYLEKPGQEKSGEAQDKSFHTLATIWLESLHKHPSEQYFVLQQLGDVALFTAGFFQDKIKRSLVDMDYYMAMGGQAYERVAHLRDSLSAEKDLNVFFELSGRFKNFAEIFAEISDQSLVHDEKSLLRLYEKWLANKSVRLARMLSERGIIPAHKVKE